MKNENTENFGDYLVPYILKKTTSQKFRWINPNKKNRFQIFKRKHYFLIGSILQFANKSTVVWGSGIIEKNASVHKAKFLAVRGPLTRNRLIELGYNVPAKYGDPAILLSLFNNPKSSLNKKFGVIPHYVDFKSASKIFQDNGDAILINVLTNDVEKTINEISDCDYIISSSLHGIIVSHALNIPALWVRLGDKLSGDDIKFYDYYHSISILEPPKIEVKNYSYSDIETIIKNELLRASPSKFAKNKLISDLIETFPFKKSETFKMVINRYYQKN